MFGAVPWVLLADLLLSFLLVLHAQGENTVFVMTNLILTLNQKQGHCPEVGAESALILPCVGGSAGERVLRALCNYCSSPASR